MKSTVNKIKKGQTAFDDETSAPSEHDHDDRYYKKDESDQKYLQSLPEHNHDDSYYKKDESDQKYLQSLPEHNHDDRYIQEEEDPTVPQHVKDITEEEVETWNNPSISAVKTTVIPVLKSALPSVDRNGLYEYLLNNPFTKEKNETIIFDIVRVLPPELTITLTTGDSFNYRIGFEINSTNIIIDSLTNSQFDPVGVDLTFSIE